MTQKKPIEEMEEKKEDISSEKTQSEDSADVTSGENLNKKDEEIAGLKKELEEQKDLMIRRQADFENYKKRSAKLQEDFKKTAIKDFACDIININDDLIRAIDASENLENGHHEESHKSFVDGVRMISGRILETLKNYGIEEIEALDKPFDPNFHEAIEMEDSEHHEIDTVTKVHQKGFKLDELVIRSSKVKVSKPSPKKPEDETEEPKEEN